MSRALLDGYLTELLARGGSDLHLRVGGPPRVRVNGVLEALPGADVLTEAVTESIAGEIIRPHLVERFARGEEVDFAYALKKGEGRFRVNAYLQRDTVAMVFRTVVTKPRTIGELGLPDMVRRFAEEGRGLVLVAGPTGSGKTTTLAAMVDHINRSRTAHVVTIEDPIEVMHTDDQASISQRELGADTPSFASAMRAALRQDPDVILVGEMRDAQTVATALMAAETGHLVLSTLHTTDASETISRIIEFFPPSEQRQVRLVLAGVLKGTVCQRLVPTADGKDRVPATEVMVVNGRVQSWIMDANVREDVQDIIADGDYYGMHSFDQAIIELYAKGTIDLRAALAAASNPHDLSVAMRLRGLDAGRGPAELQGSVEDSATAALHTLVEQLADESPVPPNGKSAKAAKAAQAKAAKAQIEAEDEVSPKPRRRRRTLTKD
jgi:twitching motility protein PilT